MPTESRRKVGARCEENESITTTYRSTFGGPGGMSPESWRYRRLDDKNKKMWFNMGWSIVLTAAMIMMLLWVGLVR